MVYWNKSRGVNLEGLGINKEPVFDYFVDYKGNVYDKEANILKGDDLKKLFDAKRGGYLGKAADGSAISAEATQALSDMNKAVGKKVKVLATPTGWLRVRDSASLDGKEITRVNVGDTYTVLEEQTGWTKIKVSETVEGWVSSDYLETVEQTKTQ